MNDQSIRGTVARAIGNCGDNRLVRPFRTHKLGWRKLRNATATRVLADITHPNARTIPSVRVRCRRGSRNNARWYQVLSPSLEPHPQHANDPKESKPPQSIETTHTLQASGLWTDSWWHLTTVRDSRLSHQIGRFSSCSPHTTEVVRFDHRHSKFSEHERSEMRQPNLAEKHVRPPHVSLDIGFEMFQETVRLVIARLHGS